MQLKRDVGPHVHVIADVKLRLGGYLRRATTSFSPTAWWPAHAA
jgi:hypothetical protein